MGLGAVRRADHRGSWAGHRRQSQADLLELPPRALAPLRRRPSARESLLGRSSACSPGQIQVQVSEPHQPVPTGAGGRGRRGRDARRLGQAGRRVVLGPGVAGDRRGPAGTLRGRAGIPHPSRGAPGPLRGCSGKALLEARPRGAEERFVASAPRKPFIFPNPHLCPAHFRGGAPGSLDLPPCCRGARPALASPSAQVGQTF